MSPYRTPEIPEKPARVPASMPVRLFRLSACGVVALYGATLLGSYVPKLIPFCWALGTTGTLCAVVSAAVAAALLSNNR